MEMDWLIIARQIRRFFDIMGNQVELDDSTAMEIADLYEPWGPGKSYPVGKILKYGVNEDDETQLYKVQQGHVSQADWLPDETPALYKKIGFDNGIPIWTQPLGQHDAWMKDDRVSHNEKIWISEINYNIWEPGVYGWKED